MSNPDRCLFMMTIKLAIWELNFSNYLQKKFQQILNYSLQIRKSDLLIYLLSRPVLFKYKISLTIKGCVRLCVST